jgi:sulfonate transport system ATP-binding protein
MRQIQSARPAAPVAGARRPPPEPYVGELASAEQGNLRINGVSKQFQVNGACLSVLDSLDLAVAPGEFLTIVGASGCGKSTLLRMVAGLDTAFQGDVILDNVRVTAPSLDRGLVFQEPRLFPWLTVAQNVALGTLNAGLLTSR